MRRPAPLVVAVERTIDPTHAASIVATIRGIRRMMSTPLMLTRIGYSETGPVGANTLLTTIPIIPQWEINICRRTEPSGHDDRDGEPRDARLIVKCYRQGDLRLAIDAVEAHVECDQPRRTEVARHVLAAAQTALAHIAAGGVVVDADDARATAWMHVALMRDRIAGDPSRSLMDRTVARLNVPWPGSFAGHGWGGAKPVLPYGGHPIKDAALPVVIVDIEDRFVTLQQVSIINQIDPLERLRMIPRDARVRRAVEQLGALP